MGKECTWWEAIPMSYVRVNIIVEGQTEETFMRDVLAPELADSGIYISARCVETTRKQHKIYRGGMTTFAKIKHDIQQWLSQDSAAYTSTMFDLYKLPNDFPNFAQSQNIKDPYQRVKSLEEGLKNTIAHSHFLPHIQPYEFEGLLFSDVEIIDQILSSVQGVSQIAKLKTIRGQFKTPEEINNSEETAPSKRLLKLYP
ncbi:MAG: DUF4276 family protein, partial [Candidatus Brocadiae bacterium]|nr:DUF4276 family protein [Candidatus Brocadiia bacterium]